MTRGWNTNFQTQMRSTDPKPVLCLRFTTGTGSSIFITSNEVDFAFPSTGGSTYSARPFVMSDVRMSGTDRPETTIECADADGYWATWLATTTFRWQRIFRILVERDELDSIGKAHAEILRVRSVDRSDRLVTFRCEPLIGILQGIRVPRKMLTREEFPGIPETQDAVF